MKNYRFLVKGGYRTFDSYRMAKLSRDWLVDHGIYARAVQVNCPVHGWHNALVGQCLACKAQEAS